jgi:hypothetical protein
MFPNIENALEMHYDSGIPNCYFTAKIAKAREYALIVHNIQDDKHSMLLFLRRMYNDFTYFFQTECGKNYGQVLLDKVSCNEDLGCAVWLHKVIETTDTSKDEIEAIFGEKVANLVWSVTNNTIDGVSEAEVCLIKISSLLAEIVQSCIPGEAYSVDKFLLLKKQYPEFKKVLFNPSHDLCIQSFWQELDSIFSAKVPGE